MQICLNNCNTIMKRTVIPILTVIIVLSDGGGHASSIINPKETVNVPYTHKIWPSVVDTFLKHEAFFT